MTDADLDRLLIDCVLDAALPARLRVALDDVCRQYGLDAPMLADLLASDEKLRDAIAEAFERQKQHGAAAAVANDSKDPRRAGKPASTPPPAPSTLPSSRLALRLVPYAERVAGDAAGGTPVAVSYVGHLDPLSPGARTGDLPPVPRANLPGLALEPLTLVVTIEPVIVAAADEGHRLGFRVAAAPETDNARDAEGEPAPLSPWQHDTGSATVLAAAERVLAAPAAERCARILELLDAMTAPVAAPDER